MKKLLSPIIISLLLAAHAVSPAYAASPIMNFNVDCDTAEKVLNIGVTTDPTDIDNGKEIIAFQLTFDLKAIGTTTKDDLKDVYIEKNPALSNIVIAENTKQEVGSLYRIRVAGGFTGQSGIKNDDLLVLKGINQKAYEIKVSSGELYEQNSINNFYPDTPVQQLSVNPVTDCQVTPPVATTPTSTSGSSGASTTSQTTQAQTTINISSTATNNIAKPGDNVTVTGVIANRGPQAISWVQSAGTQISPTTQDTEQGANQTRTDLIFTVPTSITESEIISLVLTVGQGSEAVTQSFDLSIEATLRGAAEEKTTEAEQSVQERIEERRQEAQQNVIPSTNQTTPVAQAGNIHNSGLVNSGPEHIWMLLVLSGVVLVGFNRFTKKSY
ncbi:MAG: hypothetical protein P1V18_04175 [Candidatus Gracilibacteria bacterium]|nr:hypothetical protein [Candidatus Gracilibacteria bacterium]